MPDSGAAPAPDHWRRLEEIFMAAVDVPPGKRDEYLRQACAGDQALRAEVDGLLAHDRAESPAIHSIVAAMAASLVDDKAVSPEMQSATPMPTEPEIPGEGRFVPGTLLAGRYRIIALLGRGGMGEVYRATDLTLGQPVALKLLPPGAAQNQRLLERFHGEVRVARQVAHPNICRVYDIGEAAGMPFLSMEYVDGEDLASLLLRIGRLPADRAMSTARKLCAGLAAAHERGIMHRDLKPANIMINKRGDVVIMDFGLAAIDSQFHGPEARNGTPAYMAPEQLKGAHVSARSDIYALGLVLYELFTGKRPYDGSTITKLLEQQEAAQFTRMRSIASDIEPAVERAVSRCLDPDPARRPATALEVAAMLPGGDPIAEALAAGQTPSPEAVAAGGKTEGLALKYSLPCLAMVVVGIVASLELRLQRDVLLRVPSYPPEVLAQKARETAILLGYSKPPEDSHQSLMSNHGLFAYLATLPPARSAAWLAVENPLEAEYRASPSFLIARPSGLVTSYDPPFDEPGMVRVVVDGSGRLREFAAVPYAAAGEVSQSMFEAAFRAMGFDFSRFHEVAATGLPNAPVSQLKTWKGPHPSFPDVELSVDIGSANGGITWSRVRFPWDEPASSPPRPSPFFQVLSQGLTYLFAAGVLLAAFWAARNWRLGRVDRKGAFRLAAAHFLLNYLCDLGRMHLVPDSAVVLLLYRTIGDELLWTGTLLLAYVALEPALRARWPHSIVTWNRVLAGHWKDAQVGSHILVGAAVGIAIGVASLGLSFNAGRRTWMDSWLLTVSGPQWLAAHAGQMATAILGGISLIFTVLGLRQLVRSHTLAWALATLIWALVSARNFQPASLALVLPFGIVVYGLVLFILTRLGLLAAIAAVFFSNDVSFVVKGLHWNAWYAPYGLASAALMIGIALFAFWRSLGGRELLPAPS